MRYALIAALLTMASPCLGAQPDAEAPAKRIPAFPGAEGFGANTPGGRGGRIIEVTNLNHDGPGSLQAACSAKGPRIVVFRVSGIIPGPLRVREPFITIAGQTAPGDGICIKDGPLHVEYTHDVIVRYLRVRPGDSPLGEAPEIRDCFRLYGITLDDRPCHDVILDHCSGSWGTDENLQAYGTCYNVTYQWCISSEALNDSVHPEGPHGCGMIFGGRDGTVTGHHNLLAHNDHRNPLLQSKRRKKPCIFDVRNNVIYRQGRAFTQATGGNMRLNYVGNFLKVKGPINDVTRFGLFAHNPWPQFGPIRIYVHDNIWPWANDGEQDEWGIVHPFVNGKRTYTRWGKQLTDPVATPPVTTESAAAAYESVLKFAGCTRPVRDVVDARIVAEVRAGAGGFIDTQNEVGGWPVYASAKAPADSDHDAMPDAWEKRFGFNPNDPTDGPKDLDGDGYTNVEEFLNQTDPRKPDSGAPTPQPPVRVQAGNDHIRGEAARKAGEAWLARAKTVNATKESETELLRKVRESGKEVADFLGIKFVKIPAGKLPVGKSQSHLAADGITVTLSKPFEISACEITQAQWEAVMGTRPWSGQLGAKDNREFPASYVNYLDCQEFIRRLNACGKRVYRLPTCCEWLYAARAGTDSKFGFGPGERKRKRVNEYAWTNRKKCPQPVGQLKPNPWGLYDMAGNVHEWLHGWTHLSEERWRRYLKKDGAVDPMGAPSARSGMHPAIGGSFMHRSGEFFRYLRSKHRSHYRGVEQGFRLQRALQ